MTDITTDVLVIGTGPAGSATAALLASAGVDVMVVNRYRWLANSPRAHITNQRTMEVLRDLGPEVEHEAYLHATPKELMGNNIFCTSIVGEELGRLATWGTAPESAAEHALSSPTAMNDLPQTFMEPLLFKTACARGAQGRMSCEYLSHEQDADGVTATLRDRLTGHDLTVRAKYLVGADGGNSLVAEHAGIPLEGQMGIGGSINLLCKMDLSRYVAHRPSVLYWVMQPGSNVGGIGMGVVRMVRPWNEWLIIWGYDISQPRPELTEDQAKGIIRQLVGDPDIAIDLTAISYWTVNNVYATHMQNGRVFVMGDAAHRHPPSNGLGSNTSIQDAFNLAWKLSMVLKGQAGPALLGQLFGRTGACGQTDRDPCQQVDPRIRADLCRPWHGWQFRSRPHSGQHGRALRCHPRRRRTTRGPAAGDCPQEIRIRLPRGRNEPTLPQQCHRHRRAGRTRLSPRCRTALCAHHVARRAPAACVGL